MTFSDGFKTVRATGAKEGEAVFSHEVWGSFNVTRLLADIEAGIVPHEKRSIAMIRDNVYRMLREQDIDGKRVAEISDDPKLMNKPCLFMDTHDGDHLLLDGRHRMAYWWMNHWMVYPGIMIDLVDGLKYKVRYFMKIGKQPEFELHSLEVMSAGWGKYTDAEGKIR